MRPDIAGRGINPVFTYGVFGGIVYALHDVGFIGGHFVESLSVLGIPSLVLVALVALWLLGLMYFVGQGGFRSAVGASTADEIELMALTRPAAPGKPLAGATPSQTLPTAEASQPLPAGVPQPSPAELARPQTVPSETPPAPAPFAAPLDGGGYRDRFSKQMAMVREAYGLSARETEVAELIARGNSVARIAEMLVVSENTIRTHSKRIYAKLNIHKRQELIELVESYAPAEG